MTTLINIRNDPAAIGAVQMKNRTAIRSALPCDARRHLTMIWSVEPASGRPIARWEATGDGADVSQDDARPRRLLRPPLRSREQHRRRLT